jgi:hypothetical protein
MATTMKQIRITTSRAVMIFVVLAGYCGSSAFLE